LLDSLLDFLDSAHGGKITWLSGKTSLGYGDIVIVIVGLPVSLSRAGRAWVSSRQ
jgi:hypothetical protein